MMTSPCGTCAVCRAGGSALCERKDPVKYDTNKPAVELIPFVALEKIGEVLAYGRIKYAAHNWRFGEGLAWSRLLGAALRHLFAWGRGEKVDPESGLSHLAHAACSILMLLSYENEGGGSDDRWQGREYK